MKNKVLINIAMFIIILAPLCCNENPSSPSKGKFFFQPSSQTTFLSEENLNQMTLINDSTLIFSESNSELESLKIRDIIICGITDNTPSGLLGRINYISQTYDSIRISRSNLKEAFKNCDIIFFREYQSSDIKCSKSMTGIEKKGATGEYNFRFDINDAIIYDADSNYITTEDQVIANGAISFNLAVEMTLVIRDNEIEHFLMENICEGSSEIDISSDSKLSIEPAPETLSIYYLSPFCIGPVIFSPEINITAVCNGEVSLNTTMDCTRKTKIIAGIEYINHRWNVFDEIEDSTEFVPPTFNHEVNLKSSIVTHAGLKVFGSTAISSEFDSYSRINAEFSSTSAGSLFAGMNVPIGCGPILGINIGYYYPEKIRSEKLLFTWGMNDAPTAVIISPEDNTTFSEAETIEFACQCNDPEDGGLTGDNLSWHSDRDGHIGNGVSISRSHLSINSHIITLKATDSNGIADSARINIKIIAGPDPYEYNMVTVPATSGYPMGWEGVEENEQPIHTVVLPEFQIGRYEVTYALWSDVKNWAETNGYIFANGGRQGSDENISNRLHPVTYISWKDCIVWCNAFSEKEGLRPFYYKDCFQKVEPYRDSTEDMHISNVCVLWSAKGFRLPTEAEWEYAARYVNGLNVSSGAEHSGYPLSENIEDCAWYNQNAGNQTHPVGQLQSNILGIYDMSGNVWEWVWDRYAGFPDSIQVNPRGPETGDYRILRGGSWYYNSWDCRTANRMRYFPSDWLISNGFRICRNSR